MTPWWGRCGIDWLHLNGYPDYGPRFVWDAYCRYVRIWRIRLWYWPEINRQDLEGS